MLKTHFHSCPHCNQAIESRVIDSIPSQLYTCSRCGGDFLIKPRIIRVEYDIVTIGTKFPAANSQQADNKATERN